MLISPQTTMADNTSEEADWSLYPYSPSFAAPIAFAILLFLLIALQTYQSFFHYRWKKFGITMLWASCVWLAGFITRSISVRQMQNIGLFIAQYVLVLMGPPLYAAAEYFILGRLLAYLPYHAPIHPGRVFSTFAILSAAVESLTGSGAANSAGADRDEEQRRLGLDLLKSALILQCFVEVFFFSLVAMVEVKCRKAGSFPSNVRATCYLLYITSAMILLRCIVRTVEGFEAASCDPGRQDPYCGPVSSHEWYLWVFEVANISLVVILLSIFHPGMFLPRSSKIFLDPRDGRTERLGPGFGKADKRPLWLTVLDPFNFGGIVFGSGMVVEKFWESEWPVYEARKGGRRQSGAIGEGEGMQKV